MEELTRLRSERGWSQQKLADESGVNKATINQIERGRRSPNVETLEKLADALGTGVADFFPKLQASLPFDSPQGSAERRLLKVLAGYKDLAKGLANQVEALLTDVMERGREQVGGSVGTLLRSYCHLDDAIRARLPEFLNDLNVPQAEYELALETWQELNRIEALFGRVHDELRKKGDARAQDIDELEALRRRRTEQQAAPERAAQREIS